MKLTIPQTIHSIQNDPLYIKVRFGQHGRAHAERVLLFANMIASMVQADNNIVLDMQAITIAALLHDCRKVTEGGDHYHGLNSARAACEMIDRIKLECNEDKVYDIIVRHCPPPELHLNDPASFESMAVGDADKLDRFRFLSLGGPDPRFFQLQTYSISLMDVASRVNGHKWRSFRRIQGQ